MTFSMDAREIAWVLSNHVNEFYGFHKSFTQHRGNYSKKVLYIIIKHAQTYIKQNFHDC